MKKSVMVAISLLFLIILLFSACKGSEQNREKLLDTHSKGESVNLAESDTEDSNVNPPGQLPICKNRIPISVGMVQATSVQDYETNDLTLWFEEQTNIDLSFEVYPSKDAKQKLQLMVAGGSKLPDTLMNFYALNEIDLYMYGQQKVIIPLNEYYEKYGYWTNVMFEKASNKELKKLLTCADGNIYSVPQYAEQLGNEWSARVWISKVWLDKLNLSIPVTTDDFYNVLKAFKEKDPNGNNQNDEIPYVGAQDGWRMQPWDFLFNAFVYNDTIDRYIVNNGKIDAAYVQDEWRNALRYMNKLCEEGLFSPLSFTQDNQQLQQILNLELPVVGAYSAGGYVAKPKDLTVADYVGQPPLKGPKGVQWASYFPTMPKHNFIITKYCKHPAAAFRLADFMLCEESAMRSRFGVPGRDWVEPGPEDKSMYESLGYKPRIKQVTDLGDVQNAHWGAGNPAFRTFEISEGQVWNGDPNSGEYRISLAVTEYMHKAPQEVVYKLLFTPDEADEISELKVTINDYVKQCIARFVTGDLNIETDWESYIAELNKMGLKRYMEICQSVYDRMNQN